MALSPGAPRHETGLAKAEARQPPLLPVLKQAQILNVALVTDA